MLTKLLLVCFLSCIHSINSASAPAFIKKCKIDDSKCITKSAQEALPLFAAGIPELGIEVLEPLTLPYLDASSPNLKLTLQDITAKGLGKCLVKKAEIVKDKSKLHVKLLCTVTLDGQYEMNGNIIFLRIEGKGHAHVVLRELVVNVDINLGTKKGKDGVDHWFFKSYEHSFELKDKATVDLENLFNGNDELGRAAKELFKSSPNEVITEVGPPIVKAVVKTIAENANRLFRKVPMSELVDM